MDTNGFLAINEEMARQREERERFKGMDLPFRVEFRFRGGTIHWVHYPTYEDCVKAPESKSCNYSPFEGARIERPTSRQIQKRGPRGGWKKYNPAQESQQ